MNKTILLVDDDQRLRDLLKDYLSEKNLKVFTCGDFLEAKEVEFTKTNKKTKPIYVFFFSILIYLA